MLYAIIILAIGILGGIWFLVNKSEGKEYRVWGIITMFVIAPFLTLLCGILYGISEGSGFAAIGIFVYMFPILFIVGMIFYWVGRK